MKKFSLYQKLSGLAGLIFLLTACVNLIKKDFSSAIVNFFVSSLLLSSLGSNVLNEDIKELQEKVKVLENK